MKSAKYIENFITYTILFLVPLTILPIFPNPYATAKLLILTWGLAFVLVIKVIKTLIRGSLKASLGSFDVPLILLSLVYIVSLILRTPNKMEGLFLPGSATIIIAGAILYFVINQMDEGARKLVKVPLIASATLVSLTSILALAGVFQQMTGLPQFIRQLNFTLLEGTLPTFVFLLALIPLPLNIVVSEHNMVKKLVYGIATTLIGLGAVVALFHSLPGRPTAAALPTFNTSWFVAVDSLKESPLLGVGPGNYLTAFNRFRPFSYNNSSYWTLRFTSARDFYLTMISETGILGIVALIFISLKVLERIKSFRGAKLPSELISFLILVGGLLLFPATISLLVFLFVLLALISKVQATKIHLLSSKEDLASYDNQPTWVTKLPVIVATAPVALGLLLFGYFSTRILAAEYKYGKAIQAIVRNDGQDAYNKMRDTINLNPYVDRYRATYAQLNISLASLIGSKKDLTDEEKTTVSQLIEQAIREGKATVALNINRSPNWELLSSIYRAIIPVAKEADQFTIQTLSQAIALDPLNPNLRITLGGVFYSLKDYDSAISTFQLAISTKPDLANAHYNLAIAYREKGEIEKAIEQMNLVLTLVEKDSKDYELAKAELENLEKSRPATTNKDGDVLNAPEQQPQGIEPKLNLPDEANPPQPVVTPTPEPSPSATPL